MKKILPFIFLLFVIRSFSQYPIFVTISGGDLYSLNLSNCSSRFVGSTGHGFGDIAFTPEGKLWGIEGGILYQIDTISAITTTIGPTGTQPVSLVALNNTTLLTEYGLNLYGINTADASSFFIGNIGYGASGDLTWYDNELYMTAGDLLVKIVLNNTFTTILNVSAVNSNGNLIPTCEGSATAPFPGFDNSIIGFSGNKVYKICQIDGSSQLLCSGIVPIEIPGAASITLPSQSPKPLTCFGSTPQTQNPRIKIIRNPSATETVIETNSDLQDATLTVYNSIGQKVIQMNHLTGRTITINHQNLESGVYFMRLIQSGKKQIIEKLLFVNT